MMLISGYGRKLGTVAMALAAFCFLLGHVAQAQTERQLMRPAGSRAAEKRHMQTASSSRASRTYSKPGRSTVSSLRMLQEEGSESAPMQEEAEAAPEAAPEQVEQGTPDLYYEEGGAMEMSDFYDEGGSCDGGNCCMDDCCMDPCAQVCIESLEGFIGVQGFTGPVNQGGSGSFGFNEGLNWGTPMPFLFGDAVAGQLGVRAVQANFNETSIAEDERHQVFVTGGLFRRVDWGFQGGAVIDYMHEGWYFDADFVQVRAELSWVFPCNHEVGAWIAVNDDDQVVTANLVNVDEDETWENTDIYAFFYRHRSNDCFGSTYRFFGGFTGNEDGVVGSDLSVPLNPCWDLQTGFIYLIPEESSGDSAFAEESWNVGINLVWRPYGGSGNHNYFRPLFDVASNGTFLIDRKE